MKKNFSVEEEKEINASGVESMMAAVEKAAKRLSFAREKGRDKSNLEWEVKILQKAKSGGILTPSDNERREKALKDLIGVDRDIKQTDEILRLHIDFFYLYEDVKKASQVFSRHPELINLKDLVGRGKELGCFRIVGKDERERMKKAGGKYPLLIVLNDEWYLPNYSDEHDEELAIIAEKLAALARARQSSLVDDMKKRANMSLSEIIEGEGKEGVAYIHYGPLDIEAGKKLPEGHLLLELIKDNSGAKLIILDAAGRFAQRYSIMKDKGRYLPLAYIKAGRITGYIESKDIFDDTRTFLLDVLRALGRRMEIQKEKELSEESVEISEEEMGYSSEQSAAA